MAVNLRRVVVVGGEFADIATRGLAKSTELYTDMDKSRLSALHRGHEERQLKLSYQRGPLAAGGPTTTTLYAGNRAPDAPCTAPAVRRLFDLYRGPHFPVPAFGRAAAQALPDLPWRGDGAVLHRYAVSTQHGIEVEPRRQRLARRPPASSPTPPASSPTSTASQATASSSCGPTE